MEQEECNFQLDSNKNRRSQLLKKMLTGFSFLDEKIQIQVLILF